MLKSPTSRDAKNAQVQHDKTSVRLLPPDDLKKKQPDFYQTGCLLFFACNLWFNQNVFSFDWSSI